MNFTPLKLRLIMVIGALMTWSLAIGQASSGDVTEAQYVTGKVVDSKTKNPVAAAQVRTLNHTGAATTDENGSFKIEISSPNEVLLINAFDYYPREVAVRGRDNLEISMYSQVFSGLYPEMEGLTGPVRSAYATNAIAQLGEIAHPMSVSVDNVIQSQLGGNARVISHSGINGSGSSIFIRGFNSINLNSQPLFVVDGVIWSDFSDVVSINDGYLFNPLSDIDLNDIESVSIIKDGTSFYGSKGGNGVILINTKRGTDVATKITVRAIGGITDKPVSLPMMNGDQLRIYLTDLMGTSELHKEHIDDMEFVQDDETRIRSYYKYHNNTNWDDEVYEQGNFQGYHVSVNGGDEKALYAFSIGYTGNQGVVRTTSMQRLNTRFNADFIMTDRITTGLNVGFTNLDRTLLDDGVNFYTSPTYLAMIKAAFLNPYQYTATGDLTADAEDSDDFRVGNPTAIIQNALNTNKHYRLNLGIKPAIQISPNLVLSTNFDYSLDKAKETFYSPILGVADQYIYGLGLSENVFRNQQMRNTTIFDDTRLRYTKQFGRIHHVNASAGWRYITTYYEADFAEGHNSGSDQKRNLLAEEDFKYSIGYNNEIKSISNYANVDYSYDNRYMVTAAISIDGSSRFGRETLGGFQLFKHSWGIFPALNAAWLISSEEFMSGVTLIDRLKLRGGYSISGNDAIDPYAWTPYFTTVRYMDRANGLVIDNIANTEIQWETTGKLSLGLDANLFNDRLMISADVYNNHTSNLLLLNSLPEVVGPGYFWNNGGELSNSGFEVSAIAKLVNHNLIKWEVSTSIGHYKNQILSLQDNDSLITNIYNADILTSVGNPAGVFYGYQTDGVLTNEADAEAANLKLVDEEGIEHYFTAGDMHFVDNFEDGIIDEKDKVIIGDPNPDIYGAFNSRIMIKNLTLDALITFSYGNEIYNYLRASLESGSELINQTTAMLNRWYYEGQETNQPRSVYGDPMGNARFSDRWIEDGSYVRLKTLSLNYKIPLNSGAIDEVTIWVAANNLLTLTNYLGRDPEVSPRRSVLYQGIDTGLIPVTKSYFVGLKLNL